MLAKYEKRLPTDSEDVWVAKWLNLKNATHWHDETEIIYCEKGKVVIDSESEKYILTDGDCALLSGGTIHNIYSENDAVCITALISDSVVMEITTKYSLRDIKLSNKYNIPEFYAKIKQIMFEKGDFFRITAKAHTILLLTEIFKREEKTLKIKSQNNSRYTLLKDILKVIENEFVYITFDDICKRFGYSPAHFSRLFSALTGSNFTKYLTMVKISRAVDLLQSDRQQSITEIATKCGFSSIRNFNRYFKIMTGYTPRELPKGFAFAYSVAKSHNEPSDPTLNSSILLD